MADTEVTIHVKHLNGENYPISISLRVRAPQAPWWLCMEISRNLFGHPLRSGRATGERVVVAGDYWKIERESSGDFQHRCRATAIDF
jgi:hypothetical protein